MTYIMRINSLIARLELFCTSGAKAHKKGNVLATLYNLKAVADENYDLHKEELEQLLDNAEREVVKLT